MFHYYFVALKSSTTFVSEPKNNFKKTDEVKRILRLVETYGWQVLRQKGSHIVYIKGDQTAVIPNHRSKELGKGLEKKLIKQMGIK